MEKISKPVNGFLALLISLALLAFAGWCFYRAQDEMQYSVFGGISVLVKI